MDNLMLIPNFLSGIWDQLRFHHPIRLRIFNHYLGENIDVEKPWFPSEKYLKMVGCPHQIRQKSLSLVWKQLALRDGVAQLRFYRPGHQFLSVKK